MSDCGGEGFRDVFRMAPMGGYWVRIWLLANNCAAEGDYSIAASKNAMA